MHFAQIWGIQLNYSSDQQRHQITHGVQATSVADLRLGIFQEGCSLNVKLCIRKDCRSSVGFAIASGWREGVPPMFSESVSPIASLA